MRKPDCKKCRQENAAEFKKSTFGRCRECAPMNRYNAYLASKRKFTQGSPIRSLDELLSQEWIIVHGRAKHIKAVRNMQLETVLRWLESRIFFKAIRKDDTNV